MPKWRCKKEKGLLSQNTSLKVPTFQAFRNSLKHRRHIIHKILKHSTLGLTCAMLEQAALLGVPPNGPTRCLGGLNEIQVTTSLYCKPRPHNNPGSERVQPGLKGLCVLRRQVNSRVIQLTNITCGYRSAYRWLLCSKATQQINLQV